MRLSRRRNAPEPVQCSGYFHIIRTGPLVFRTPTQHETRIARAGASDARAQRWLGWPTDRTYSEAQRAALLVSPSDGAERPTVPTIAAQGHLVAIDAKRLAVAGQVDIEAMPDGRLYVGGWLTPDYRGAGLGRELFAAGLTLGHQHLGIRTLRAGAEEANHASRRSLEAAGFRQIQEGDPAHRLPDGRVILCRWYEHSAPAPSHCHHPA
jgi:RimJ/RimL family protein N-acetyltransferase